MAEHPPEKPIRATPESFWNLPPIPDCSAARQSRLSKALGAEPEEDAPRQPCRYIRELQFDRDHHVLNLNALNTDRHAAVKSRYKNALVATKLGMILKTTTAMKAKQNAEDAAKSLLRSDGTSRVPRPYEDPLFRLQRKMVNEDKDHFIQIHALLLELWRAKVLCDVHLKAMDTVIPVHSALLEVHTEFWSPYCYEHNITKLTQLPIEIDFKNQLTTLGLRSIINYFYTGKLKVRHENCVEIFDVARTLRMPELARSTENFVKTLLENHNLWSTVSAARDTPSALFDIAWTKLATRFVRLSKTPEFAEIEVDDLVWILKSDELLITSEMQVFDAALFWMKSKMEGRMQHFKTVLECIRFAFMTTDELIQCMNADPLFQEELGVQFLCSANLAKMFANQNENWSGYDLVGARNPEMRPYLKAVTGPEEATKQKENTALVAIDAQVSTTALNLSALLDARYQDVCCKQPTGYRCKS